jgi:hypothetical protein
MELGINDATNELTVCTGSLHGSEMLKGVRNLPQIILAWLKAPLLGVTAPTVNRPPPIVPPDATAPPK